MDEKDTSNFPIGGSAQERGYSHVPECYVLPTVQRPSQQSETVNVPMIDLSLLHQSPLEKSQTIVDIGEACRRTGFFQIINHGISESVMDGALASAKDFFDLPMEGKTEFMSNDIYKPVRYSTSLKDGVDKVQFWRVFLKHYAHPLEDWIGSWPHNPSRYREEMGSYAIQVRKVAIELMGAITESLGLGPTCMHEEIKDGMQVMAVNCYPPCPQPELALGLPPHSDYSCITILLQSCTGLQIVGYEDSEWRVVPQIKGALEVHVGDHFEVLSNGLYKSVVHRVTLNSVQSRLSVASLHSLGIDVKMASAGELVNEHNPKGYRESSFSDFLNFLTDNDLTEGRSFLETLKIKQ
ncbi:hypothetical protein GIB67_012459 [Kingdonia uniflora]|uniref:Fe2OG dioxygenase domain-containing protein n=1 Tax=Kingdonia uniflora TaxID=39325 RepID=A0A7J7MVC4_9MAGN|nr:hypothetical protein GIB67_012459 [Kingdonia uniflora]